MRIITSDFIKRFREQFIKYWKCIFKKRTHPCINCGNTDAEIERWGRYCDECIYKTNESTNN